MNQSSFRLSFAGLAFLCAFSGCWVAGSGQQLDLLIYSNTVAVGLPVYIGVSHREPGLCLPHPGCSTQLSIITVNSVRCVDEACEVPDSGYVTIIPRRAGELTVVIDASGPQGEHYTAQTTLTARVPARLALEGMGYRWPYHLLSGAAVLPGATEPRSIKATSAEGEELDFVQQAFHVTSDPGLSAAFEEGWPHDLRLTALAPTAGRITLTYGAYTIEDAFPVADVAQVVDYEVRPIVSDSSGDMSLASLAPATTVLVPDQKGKGSACVVLKLNDGSLVLGGAGYLEAVRTSQTLPTSGWTPTSDAGFLEQANSRLDINSLYSGPASAMPVFGYRCPSFGPEAVQQPFQADYRLSLLPEGHTVRLDCP